MGSERRARLTYARRREVSVRTVAIMGASLTGRGPRRYAQDVPAAPKVNAICTPPSGFELTGKLGGGRYRSSYDNEGRTRFPLTEQQSA